MKYPVLILAAAIGVLAVAPPPPPPPPNVTQPQASPTAAAPTPATSAAPPTQASPDANASLDNLFGKPRSSTAPKATPTPPADARKGLDGVWELQIQRGANTQYEHFNLKQSGNTLTGIYLTQHKKKFPLAGSVDGRNIRLVISLSDGTTILLEGRLDGTTDMLGMMTDAKERVPFTAAYRPKEKWIDNLNASPAGSLGGGMGGGYPPN